MPLDGRSASCECAATSSETIESRAVLSETDSPRLHRASPGMASGPNSRVALARDELEEALENPMGSYA